MEKISEKDRLRNIKHAVKVSKVVQRVFLGFKERVKTGWRKPPPIPMFAQVNTNGIAVMIGDSWVIICREKISIRLRPSFYPWSTIKKKE